MLIEQACPFCVIAVELPDRGNGVRHGQEAGSYS
jgi:hypothetical protein